VRLFGIGIRLFVRLIDFIFSFLTVEVTPGGLLIALVQLVLILKALRDSSSNLAGEFAFERRVGCIVCNRSATALSRSWFSLISPGVRSPFPVDRTFSFCFVPVRSPLLRGFSFLRCANAMTAS
jgi:hypothetical protein